jgi:hypothetical protein
MPFTYPQITIGAQAYDAYVDLAAANLYLNGSVNAAAWTALSDDDKGRAIVSAVRVIDSMPWKGEKTEADNALAWPRTCLDGDPPGTLPAALVTATIQLAFAISQNPELAGGSVSAQGGTRRLKAGSVEIEYFNSGITSQQAAGSSIGGILAPLADCLDGTAAGSILGAGAYSSGTDRCSPFADPDYGFARGV